MVTSSFGVGSTTWADFQNAASVACASGSAAIPLRIAPGVRRRRPDQSVLRLAFAVARFARDALLFFIFIFIFFIIILFFFSASISRCFSVLASLMPKPTSIREFGVLP